MKQCSACHEFKSLDMFYRVSNSNKHRSQCKQCSNIRNKTYVSTKEGRANKIAAQKAYRARGGGKYVAPRTEEQRIAKNCAHYKRKYGITCEQREKMLQTQSNECANCSKDLTVNKYVIDHDHTTNEIRGILCYNCNVGIGLLGDSIEGLEQALYYLRRNNADYQDD